MKTEWTGDADLVRAVERAFRSQAAAVAVVSPGREMTATVGAGHDSAFEVGSISKALTGMLYRDATERGLISQTTVLREVLPLGDHGEVGSVPLGSLAIPELLRRRDRPRGQPPPTP